MDAHRPASSVDDSPVSRRFPCRCRHVLPQVGGALRYAVNHSLPADARLVAAEVPARNGGAAVPLEQQGTMLLLLNNYYAGGGDK